MESMGFIKGYELTHLIAPTELNLVLWNKSGEVDIPTKFQEI